LKLQHHSAHIIPNWNASPNIPLFLPPKDIFLNFIQIIFTKHHMPRPKSPLKLSRFLLQ